METVNNKAVKHDGDKIRMELVPQEYIRGTAEVFSFGAKKYSADNWRYGMEYSRLFGALQRHMSSFWLGEENDPESGMSHLYHASCCLAMLDGMRIANPEMDDRPCTKNFKAVKQVTKQLEESYPIRDHLRDHFLSGKGIDTTPKYPAQ